MFHCFFNMSCFSYIILQCFIPFVYTDKRQLHLVPTSRKFDEPKNRIIVDLPDYHKQSYVNGNFDFVDRDHGDVKLELTDHGVLIPGLNFFTNGEKKASFTDTSDKDSDKNSNVEKSYREFQENQRRITELENSLLKKEDIDRNSDGQRKAQEIDLKSEALAKIEELAKQNLEDIAKLKMDAFKERQKISPANDKNEAAGSISSKEKSNEKDSNDTSVTENNSISNLAESLHIKHDSDKHDNSSDRSETEQNDSDSSNTSGNAPKPENVHTSSAEALNNVDYPLLSESKGTKEKSSASIVAAPSGNKDVKASGEEPKKDTAKDKKPLIDARSDDKVEAKIDGNAVAKIESKTESRIEGKTEDKIEAKTEGKTEDKVESKTVARIEGKTEARIEGKTEGRIEGITESRIEGKTEARIEGKTEPRIEGKGEEKIEAKTESNPDIESKAAVEIKGADEANEKPIEPKLDEEKKKKKKKIKILILDDDEALPLSSSSLSDHVPEPVPFQYQASVQPQSKPSSESDQQSSPSASNHPLVHVMPPNQLHMDQQMGFERPRYDGFDKQDQSLNMHNPEFASHFNPCSSQVGYQQHVFDNGASSHMFNCHETRQLNENNNGDQFNGGMMRQNLYNNNNNINNNNPLTNHQSDSNFRPEIHYHFHISKDNLKDLKPINSFNQAPFVKDQLGEVVSTEDKPNEDLNKQQVPELSQYLPMFRQVGDDITNNFRKQYNSNQLPDRMHYSNNDIQRNDNNPQNSYQRFLTKRTFKKISRSAHKKNITRFLKHKKIKKYAKHSHLKILKTLKKTKLNSK